MSNEIECKICGKFFKSYRAFNDKIHKYFVDFKIKENNKWKLIEIKSTHNWFYNDIKSGKLESKFNSAIEYSKNNNYLEYVFILDKKEYYTFANLKNDIKK